MQEKMKGNVYKRERTNMHGTIYLGTYRKNGKVDKLAQETFFKSDEGWLNEFSVRLELHSKLLPVVWESSLTT